MSVPPRRRAIGGGVTLGFSIQRDRSDSEKVYSHNVSNPKDLQTYTQKPITPLDFEMCSRMLPSAKTFY
jgi:hypothetical protein